jgi:uncharacterized protein YndB with AHSA1/START domain
LSGEKVVVQREIFIAASPKTVFGFLIDPALMARWIGVSHSLEPRPGGSLRIKFSRGDVAFGHFKEVVPHRRVAFTWGWEPDHEGQNRNLTILAPGASLVEIDLEPKQGGTLLRLRHSHVPSEIAQRHGERWSHYLAQLEVAAQARENEPKTATGISRAE